MWVCIDPQVVWQTSTDTLPHSCTCEHCSAQQLHAGVLNLAAEPSCCWPTGHSSHGQWPAGDAEALSHWPWQRCTLHVRTHTYGTDCTHMECLITPVWYVVLWRPLSRTLHLFCLCLHLIFGLFLVPVCLVTLSVILFFSTQHGTRENCEPEFITVTVMCQTHPSPLS